MNTNSRSRQMTGSDDAEPGERTERIYALQRHYLRKSEWFGVLCGKTLHRRNHDDRISEKEGDSVKFDRKGISERDQ